MNSEAKRDWEREKTRAKEKRRKEREARFIPGVRPDGTEDGGSVSLEIFQAQGRLMTDRDSHEVSSGITETHSLIYGTPDEV